MKNTLGYRPLINRGKGVFLTLHGGNFDRKTTAARTFRLPRVRPQTHIKDFLRNSAISTRFLLRLVSNVSSLGFPLVLTTSEVVLEGFSEIKHYSRPCSEDTNRKRWVRRFLRKLSFPSFQAQPH